MGSKIGLIGGGFTFLYLIATAALLASRWADLKELPLNELGDCLAGIFGPLAILWLVLGFFQQGLELRQNSEALKMQAKELGNSVAEQAMLVKVAQAQLDADREAIEAQKEAVNHERAESHRLAQPQFTLQKGNTSFDGRSIQFGVFIANTGPKQCTAYSAFFEGETMAVHKSSKFGSGERGDFTCAFSTSSLPLTTTLRINFTDANGFPGQQLFNVSVSRDEIDFLKI